MMTKKYNLAVPVGKYTVNGQEKTRWEIIGSVMSGDKGPYIMLKATFNPAAVQRKEGSDCIVISLFTPKDNSQQNYPQQNTQANNEPRHDFDFNEDAQNVMDFPF